MAKPISRNPELNYEWWKKNKPKDLAKTGLGEALREFEAARERFMAATDPKTVMLLANGAGTALTEVSKAITKAIGFAKKDLDKYGDLKKALENYDGVIQIEKRVLTKHRDDVGIPVNKPTRGSFETQMRICKENLEANDLKRAEHDTAADEFINRLGTIASRDALKQLAQEYAPKKGKMSAFLTEQIAWSRTEITGLKNLKDKPTTDAEKQTLKEVAGLLVGYQQRITALRDKWDQLDTRFVQAATAGKVKVKETE